MEQQNRQILQEAEDLLEQVKRFSVESAAKLNAILEKMKRAEEENQTRQEKIDNEIEQIADETDAATIDFVKKIGE